MNLIEKFRRLLVVSDLPHDVKNLLSNGVFEYNFSEKAVVQFDGLHFHELKIPGIPTRCSETANKTDVLLRVRSWYDEIAKNIDLYLSVPKIIISLASQVFKLNPKVVKKMKPVQQLHINLGGR